MIYYVGDLHGRVEEMMSVDRAAIKAGSKLRYSSRRLRN